MHKPKQEIYLILLDNSSILSSVPQGNSATLDLTLQNNSVILDSVPQDNMATLNTALQDTCNSASLICVPQDNMTALNPSLQDNSPTSVPQADRATLEPAIFQSRNEGMKECI